jgi:hypothetical protein
MNLQELGFRGDVKWVLNEEGSGARAYKSSCYYPDDVNDIKTSSGITIDPGLDLGNADVSLVHNVLDIYMSKGLLTDYQRSLLLTAVGLKRNDAARWIKAHRKDYKNSFLVPIEFAAIIMSDFTAIPYWKHMKDEVDEIDTRIISAVHTVALDLSYNKGWARAEKIFHLAEHDINDTIADLRSCKESTRSLSGRREREAALIEKALAAVKENVPLEFTYDDLNAVPLTVILPEHKSLFDTVFEMPPIPDYMKDK